MLRLVCAIAALVIAGIAREGISQRDERPSPPHKSAQNSPIGLNAGVGYADYQMELKPDRWYPAWALVQAREYDVDGRLLFHQEGNPMEVEIPARVAKGTAKLFHTYFKPVNHANSQPTIQVEIEARRFGGDSIPVPARYSEDRAKHILVLAEEQGAFSFLTRRSNQNLPGTANVVPDRIVAYGKAAFLPENAIALEPIDVLIISTEEVRAITKTQWGAIEIWVRLGGKLILAAGRHQPFVIESNLNGAFGVEFGHSEPFNLYGDTPTASKVEVLASWPSMHGEGWDRIWLGTEDHPLFAGKQIGRGWFMPCAAALDPPMLQFINSRPDATSWWFSLLESDSGQTPLRTRLNDLEGPLGMSLQAPFAMNLAGAWWVFGYLLSYMLLVVPINWIIFSRLKRKEWAWGTAVLLAVGYSWYGYSTGARSQGKNFQINEASFVSRPDVDAPARGTTFSAIYSPRRFRTDIRSNGPVFPAAMSDFELNWGYRNGEGDLYRNSPLMLSFGDSAMAKGFFLYPWSARNVRSDFLLPAGGSVSVESPLTLDEGGISGQIKNNTAWTFNHWWVLQGSRGWESATPLPQGESQQFANLKPAIVDWASWMTSNVSRRFRPPTERPEQARSYGMQYYLDQQLKYFWDNFRQFNLPSDQALFFGIAEGSASPMTEGMTPDLRVGLIFYEQDLRGKLASTSKDTAASGTIWMPTLLSGQPQWMIGPVSHGKDSKLGPGWQVVPTNIVSLQLTPDPAPEGGIAGELEINFKVIGMPEDTYEKNGIQINGSRYTFAGCPVSIYNFRLQSWETERVWLGQPLRFQGAPDYLQPANHSIALRLNLSAQEMRWKKLNPREEEKNAVTKDLWGGYTPMNFLRFGDCGVNFIEPSSGAAGGTP